MLSILSQRYNSSHNPKFILSQSLRKQHQLQNRINVLLYQKDKKLKLIQKQQKHKHSLQQLKHSKTFTKQKSILLQLNKALDKKHTNNKNLKKQIQTGIKLKKQTILQLNRQKYIQIKRCKELNNTKIQWNRNKVIQQKKIKKNHIKLMQLHWRDNIKHFWQDKLEDLINKKNKENQIKYNLYQNSLVNISILQQKENALKEDIENSIIYAYSGREEKDKEDGEIIDNLDKDEGKEEKENRENIVNN